MNCFSCYGKLEESEDFCPHCGVHIVKDFKRSVTPVVKSEFQITINGRAYKTSATSEGKAKNNAFFQYAKDRGASVKLVHHWAKTKQLTCSIKKVG